MSKEKVKMEVEKILLQYTKELGESSKDFVMLYGNKYELGIERVKLEKILELVKQSLEQTCQSQLSIISQKLDTVLTEHEKELLEGSQMVLKLPKKEAKDSK